MPLGRLPGATRRDAHLLVVVADRAARGEGITEPETVVGRNAVGDVRESRRALVGRHHQVGVIAIVTHDAGRRHHRALDQVVGQVEQARQEQFVAGHAFGSIGLTLAGWRRILEHETALGADRNDDGVLDMLGLDQPQNFGAEILAPIRPADAAARDLAVAQMNAFNTR